MIFNLISMLVIIITWYGVGVLGARKIIGCTDSSLDMDVVTGLCFCGIFAEIVSLFSGVGAIASILVFIIGIVGCVFSLRTGLLKETVSYFRDKKNRELKALLIIIAVIIFCFFALDCARLIRDDDDFGYHIQAIKWINEYGLVPGQGNLHFRFGFNSAFLSLQALFNFFFLGYEYHSVNALAGALLAIYSVFTVSFEKKNIMSDLLKGLAVLYVFTIPEDFVGVETDPLAVLFLIYIIIKIVEDRDMRHSEKWRELIILFSCYGVTLKLSIGACLIYPAVLFIYLAFKKRCLSCLRLSIIGILSIFPYLIRNVFISGFLLYPSTSLDLFNIDWKIPASINKYCIQGIIIYGRNTQKLGREGISWDVLYAQKIWEWLPVWFGEISLIWRCVFILSVFFIVLFSIIFIRSIINKTFEIFVFLPGIISVCGYFYWLFSAPSIRFGGIIMGIISVITISLVLERFDLIKLKRICAVFFTFVFICTLIFVAIKCFNRKNGIVSYLRNEISLVFPKAYPKLEVSPFEIYSKEGDTVTAYVPKEGGHCDPYSFPVTNSSEYIGHLELRGKTIKSGFRYIE